MRDIEPSRIGRLVARYASALSVFGVIGAGCATQANDDRPGGDGASSGSSNAGAGKSSAAGSSSSAGGSGKGGGTAAAGASSNPGTSGSGGMTTAGSGGAADTAGGGGKAGAGGRAGAEGVGGKSGAGGAGGSGGAGGGRGTDCSVVTDCGVQSVCDGGTCRARGCNATDCAYDMTSFALGTPVAASARGQAFVSWNATSLQVNFQIFDKTPENDSADNFDDDSAEIYLDLNHARSGVYDADDYQINIPRDAGTLVGFGTKLDSGAITVMRTENVNGYELKVTWPWSAMNGAGSQVGKTIGFDLAFNDDRDGGSRETQIILYGNKNAHQDSSQFGDLTLTP